MALQILSMKLKIVLYFLIYYSFLLFLVHNSTDEDLTVSNCWVLPSSCHWATRSPTEPSCDHLGRDWYIMFDLYKTKFNILFK